MSDTSTPASASAAATDYVHQLLGKTIVCTLDDGRTVKGTFICMDRLSNIILTNNVVEERVIHTADYRQYNNTNKQQQQQHSNDNDDDDDDDEITKHFSSTNNNREIPMKRHLEQAMIQGSRLVKVELEQAMHDQILSSLQLENQQQQLQSSSS